jgi:hypothetical protein
LLAPTEPEHVMTNEVFATAAALRLRFPARSVGPCGHAPPGAAPCGEAGDEAGDHALMCPKGGWVVARNDAIARALAHIARKCLSVPVEMEPAIPGARPDTPRARADLAWEDLESGRRVLVDVVVGHYGAQESMRRNAAALRDGCTAALQEGRKRRLYGDAPVDPAAWETWGGRGTPRSG